MLNPVPEPGTPGNPVRLTGPVHLIAPVCGTCGREIDKDGHQWRHVSEPLPVEPEATTNANGTVLASWTWEKAP